MNVMKAEQTRQIRRAALAAGVGAVLVAGVLVFVPDPDREAAAPGPEARAMAAVGAGAPAAPRDLAALIRDRETWVRAHPDDGAAWAVLGSAYVQHGVGLADPAYYPKAERALRRSLAVTEPAAGRSSGDGESGGGGGGGGTGKGRDDDGKTGAARDPAALLGLGALANARHDYAAAKRWGETVRAQHPGQWAAYPVLITAYSGLGEYAAAGRALSKLKDLRTDSPVLTRAAEVYRDKGWREDAAAKATEAVASATTPAEKARALHTLGELAWERGEPTEALGHFDAALAVTRDHAASLAGRARTLASLGRTDEASRGYQAALRKLPRPEYALELGELYDSMGLDGDARTQYEALRERTVASQGNGVNEELVLARFEADHGDPQAAVLRMKSEWGQLHRSMEAADALGWALFRAGQAKEALKYAKRATNQGPRSALFSYHRGEIERALGMQGPARRHIGEALRVNPHFSPLLVPTALDALEALGEPADGGPADVDGTGPEPPTLTRKSPAATTAPASPSAPASPATPAVPSEPVVRPSPS
ncbi:tetratricopeptide repeat protein [Streptomyces sp. NPDC012623]|uniref:tetratricopeptide repeat protein n=1 Tax=unclassified Streptomyces TaxID=2593676 RepID=UPI0036B8BEC9